MTWNHGHQQIVTICSGQFVCLECGRAFDESADDSGGNPREYWIPAVLMLRTKIQSILQVIGNDIDPIASEMILSVLENEP